MGARVGCEGDGVGAEAGAAFRQDAPVAAAASGLASPLEPARRATAEGWRGPPSGVAARGPSLPPMAPSPQGPDPVTGMGRAGGPPRRETWQDVPRRLSGRRGQRHAERPEERAGKQRGRGAPACAQLQVARKFCGPQAAEGTLEWPLTELSGPWGEHLGGRFKHGHVVNRTGSRHVRLLPVGYGALQPTRSAVHTSWAPTIVGPTSIFRFFLFHPLF